MSKIKLELEVEKDGWTNDIVLLKEDDGIVLIVVGDEFELSSNQVNQIKKFLK